MSLPASASHVGMDSPEKEEEQGIPRISEVKEQTSLIAQLNVAIQWLMSTFGL